MVTNKTSKDLEIKEVEAYACQSCFILHEKYFDALQCCTGIKDTPMVTGYLCINNKSCKKISRTPYEAASCCTITKE